MKPNQGVKHHSNLIGGAPEIDS